MLSLQDSFLVVSQIALFLGGVYGLIYFIQRLSGRYLQQAAERLRLTENTLIALLGNFVSNLVIFSHFEKLPARDRLLTSVLSVSAAFTVGGQLAYISSVEPGMVPVFLTAKITCALVSLLLFAFFGKRILNPNAN